MYLLGNKFSKFVIKKALKIISKCDLENVVYKIEEELHKANVKDYEKLNKLIKKLKEVSFEKEYD